MLLTRCQKILPSRFWPKLLTHSWVPAIPNWCIWRTLLLFDIPTWLLALMPDSWRSWTVDMELWLSAQRMKCSNPQLNWATSWTILAFTRAQSTHLSYQLCLNKLLQTCWKKLQVNQLLNITLSFMESSLPRWWRDSTLSWMITRSLPPTVKSLICHQIVEWSLSLMKILLLAWLLLLFQDWELLICNEISAYLGIKFKISFWVII